MYMTMSTKHDRKPRSRNLPLEALQVAFTLRIIVTVAMTFRQWIRRDATTTEWPLESKFRSWHRSRKRGSWLRSRLWSRFSCWIRVPAVVFSWYWSSDATRDRFVTWTTLAAHQYKVIDWVWAWANTRLRTSALNMITYHTSPGWHSASVSQSPSHRPRGKLIGGLPSFPFINTVSADGRRAQ